MVKENEGGGREAEGEGGGRKLKLKGDPQGKVTFASSGTDANWRRPGPRERVTAASGSIKDLSHPDRGGGDGGACCAWVIRGERERGPGKGCRWRPRARV